MKNKIISNTLFQLVGKLFSMLITVAVTMIIARFYGREGYGNFNLMQTWPALFFIIADFGFNAIAVKDITNQPQKAGIYFKTILYMRLFLAAFFVIFLTILLNYFPYSGVTRFGIQLNLLLIVTQALYSTTNILFQYKLRYDLATIGYLAGYVYILLSILIMSYYHVDIMWISFNYVIGGAITYLISVLLFKKLDLTVPFTFDKTLTKYLAWQSLPLGLMFIFSQINFKSDSIMLSVLNLPSRYGLNNTESVAIYGLAYKIFEVALVFPTFFMNAAYPVLVQKMGVNQQEFKKSLLQSFIALFFMGILVSIIGIIFSEFAIDILGGAAFAQSVTVLKILMAGLVIYFLTQPLSWLLVALDKQKYLPYIYAVSAIFNVFSNYLFIQRYSFYASAVITHLSELLILILLAVFSIKAWKAKYNA